MLLVVKSGTVYRDGRHVGPGGKLTCSDDEGRRLVALGVCEVVPEAVKPVQVAPEVKPEAIPVVAPPVADPLLVPKKRKRKG